MKEAALKQLIENIPTLTKLSEGLYPDSKRATALANLNNKVKGNDNRYLTETEQAYIVKELQDYAEEVLKQFPVKEEREDLFMKALGK